MWRNPMWGSLRGPDAEILRAIFQSLQDWTRNPDFGNVTDPGPASDAPEAVKIYNEHIRSSNYVQGSAGWQINATGEAEFNNVWVRGTITGSTITGGTISGTTITGVTITGSTFKTASSGLRVEIGGSSVGFIDFYSGHANEWSHGRITEEYALNRSRLRIESGGNFSDHKARIELNSGPDSGGRGQLVFIGYNNLSATAFYDLDEHHYMGSAGLAASRWYGAGNAERFRIDNAGAHATGILAASGDLVSSGVLRDPGGGSVPIRTANGDNLDFTWDGFNLHFWINGTLVKSI